MEENVNRSEASISADLNTLVAVCVNWSVNIPSIAEVLDSSKSAQFTAVFSVVISIEVGVVSATAVILNVPLCLGFPASVTVT